MFVYPIFISLVLGVASGLLFSSAKTGFLVAAIAVGLWLLYWLYSLVLYPHRTTVLETEYLRLRSEGKDPCIIFGYYRPQLIEDVAPYTNRLFFHPYVNAEGIMISAASVRQYSLD